MCTIAIKFNTTQILTHNIRQMQPSDKNSHHTPELIDARGLVCPMPLLKAKQALSKLQVGQRIKLLATDPGSVKDIRSFANLTQHQLVEYRELSDHHVYVLEKG